MPKPLPESDVEGFLRDGFIILRDMIPPALIRDLRRECEKGVAAVRAEHPPPADPQRFQPVSKFAERLDTKPFRDYAELPALHDAFKQVLGPEVFYGRLDVMGVFIEPARLPWTATWHRD